MIRLMVMYPRTDGTEFNADYWTHTHMPMLTGAWPDMAKWEADLCDEASGYFAIANIYFPSPAEMQSSMGAPGTAAVMADVANYYNGKTTMMVNNIANQS